MKTIVPAVQAVKLDVVRRAATCVLPPEVSVDDLLQAEEEVAILGRLRESLLPIEALNRPGIEISYASAMRKLGKLMRQTQIVEYSEGEYRILDPSPLRWRDEEMLPIFAVFRPERPEWGIHCRFQAGEMIGSIGSTSIQFLPPMPPVITDCFTDVTQLMRNKVRDLSQSGPFGAQKVDLVLKTRFNGLIPDEVREEIVQAKSSGLFIQLFIIAEVEKWAWNVAVVSRKGDPLVVGFDGYQLWLIRAFDTTSLEERFAKKFSSKS